jgi:hypothetical protein
MESSGQIHLTKIPKKDPSRQVRPATPFEVVKNGLPSLRLPEEIRKWRMRNLFNLARGFKKVQLAHLLEMPHFRGDLYLKVIRANGQELDLGLASMRVVTDAGVAAIVDAFQNSVELETFKYHGIGTGSTAEAAGDTDIETELTTQYQTDNTRATGTLTEGATANIFRTVATNTVDAGVSLREHGVLTSATVGAGTLLDRSVYALITLSASDSLQSTYDLTLTAGS